MKPDHMFTPSMPADDRLSHLAKLAGQLGYEIVDIAGVLDIADQESRNQLVILDAVQTSASNVLSANAAVREALDTVTSVTSSTLEQVEGSVQFVRESGQRSNAVAGWVQALTDRMDNVANSVTAVEKNNALISDIARQVNILAINAKIEAARAGDSGRGFGVVADAINELSKKTANAARGIEENVEHLGVWVGKLREEAKGVSDDANKVLAGSGETDKALIQIAQGVRETNNATQIMSNEAIKVHDAVSAFQPSFDKIGTAARTSASGLGSVRGRVHELIDTSETIFQTSVALGGGSDDMKFIDKVKAAAAQISEIFSAGVRTHQVSVEALFDYQYQKIAGTDPAQYLTKSTKFADDVLPAIQESMLDFDPKVVFCAAIDPQGYLPTHNKKFSQPQRSDPVWNAANARNRRLFDDRVGLKAGRNTEPFLLQVYRRDMGAGQFVMMKDLSAPIYVDGRHWGGLRVGYTF
jgi:methyl-accepting chemotaxis protein